MGEKYEVASKQNFLSNFNLSYKNEYEFGTGLEFFDFISNENLLAIGTEDENTVICDCDQPTSDYSALKEKEQDVRHEFDNVQISFITENEQRKREFNDRIKNIPIFKNENNRNNIDFQEKYVLEKIPVCELDNKVQIDFKIRFPVLIEKSNELHCNNLKERINKNVFEGFQVGSNLNNIEYVIEGCEEETIENTNIEEIHSKFRCTICQKDFPTNFERTHHVNFHLEKHVCPFCAKTFTQKNYLLEHCTLHLRNKTAKSIKEERTSKKWICSVCFKVFDRKFNLRRHLESVHINNDEVSQKSLKESKLTHSLGSPIKELQCHICMKIFSKLSVVKRHVKNVHCKAETSNDKISLQCDECNRTFLRKLSFKKHLNHVHHIGHDELIKRNVCPICFKKYKSVYHVKRHIKIHDNKKNFKCKVCQKTFATTCHLKTHASVHLDIKKYNCKVCSRSFSTGLQLEDHIKIRHETMQQNPSTKWQLQQHTDRNDKKSFKCAVCTKAFGCSSHLKRHLKMHFRK